MLRNTAVWRRALPATDYKNDQEPPELTCAENPANRQDGRTNHFGVAARAQVLTLKEYAGLKPEQITAITGVKRSEIFNIIKRAKERGYDKEQPLQDAFFRDAARPGRPPVVKDEVAKEVKTIISRDRNTRTLTLVEIARRLRQNNVASISPQSVWRTLRATGYRKVKPTRKPGLTEVQKKARFEWCLQHLYWTLNDWKRVLWSDETSVVYGHRRGGERVWRTVYEVSAANCRRNRWRGSQSSCFGAAFHTITKGLATSGPKRLLQRRSARKRTLITATLRASLSAAVNRSYLLRLGERWSSVASQKDVRLNGNSPKRQANSCVKLKPVASIGTAIQRIL